MRFLVVLLLALCASIAIGQQTGLKSTISENGLSYIKDIGLQILHQQLQTVSIPDINGDTGTPVGSISYSLTSIRLTGLNIPSASIQLVPGQGVNAVVSGASAHITLNWSYREDSWPHISDGGSADIDISGVSISVTVHVGESQGRPTVSVASCGVNIGSVSIDLHGGASWLYNLFTGLFSGQIQSGAQGALQQGITQAINQQAEQALATIPIMVQIDTTSEVNFELVSVPEFTSSYLTTDHLGEFYWTQKPSEAPYTAAAMPDTVAAQMLQVFVSDYVVNSAGYAYFQAGRLVAKVNPSDVPSWSPVHLNTTDFKELIPGLYAQYPNLPMQLVLASTQPPVGSFLPTGFEASVPGECIVNVLLPNGTQTEALTIGIVGSVGGNATVSSATLRGQLWFINATLSLIDSHVGDVDVQDLQTLVNMMCEYGVLPLLNQYAQHGFPLPIIDGVTLTNPQVSYGAGYLAVATDFTYNPSESTGNLDVADLEDCLSCKLRQIIHSAVAP